ncbi:MAG: VCBS repeat-containing protein, partial [Bacteroidota bacterium]
MKPFFITILLCVYAYLNAQDFSSSLQGPSVGGFVVADFNQDTFPDLIYPQRISFQGNKRIVIRQNTGNDTLAFTNLEFVINNEVFGTPAAADFDNDGDLDIIFSSLAEASLIYLQQNPENTLDETELTVDGAVALYAANLNGDEFPDIVGYDVADQTIVTYTNTDGTSFTRSVVYDTGLSIDDFQVTDLDQDGLTDILVGTNTFNGPALTLLTNDGTGSYSSTDLEATSD